MTQFGILECLTYQNTTHSSLGNLFLAPCQARTILVPSAFIFVFARDVYEKGPELACVRVHAPDETVAAYKLCTLGERDLQD